MIARTVLVPELQEILRIVLIRMIKILSSSLDSGLLSLENFLAISQSHDPLELFGCVDLKLFASHSSIKNALAASISIQFCCPGISSAVRRHCVECLRGGGGGG